MMTIYSESVETDNNAIPTGNNNVYQSALDRSLSNMRNQLKNDLQGIDVIKW